MRPCLFPAAACFLAALALGGCDPVEPPAEPAAPESKAPEAPGPSDSAGPASAGNEAPEKAQKDPGTDPTPADPAPPSATFGSRSGPVAGLSAEEAVVTDALPFALGEAAAGELSAEGAAITGGRAKLEAGARGGSALTRFAGPPGRVLVRVKFLPERGQSMLGQAMSAAGDILPAMLETDRGSLAPLGYVLARRRGGLEVRYERDSALGQASQGRLPVRDLGEGDVLYAYYPVEPGTSLEAFKMGKTRQSIDLKVK